LIPGTITAVVVVRAPPRSPLARSAARIFYLAVELAPNDPIHKTQNRSQFQRFCCLWDSNSTAVCCTCQQL